jgi:tetratricopeptide (TPR) repeat protein
LTRILPRPFVLLAILLLLLPSGARQQGELPSSAGTLFRKADRLFQQAARTEDEVAADTMNRRALQLYEQLVATNGHPYALPDSLLLLAHSRSGELQQYFGAYDAAMNHYSAVIARQRSARGLADSLVFRPNIFCGIIAYAQNRFDSARRYFEEAERIQAHYPKPLAGSERLYNNMGALLFESGNYRQARNHFYKALELLPKDHPYYDDFYANYQNNLATIHIRLAEYDSALAIYNRLLPRGLQQPEICNNIGIIHLRQGRPSEALEWFRRVHYSDVREAGLRNDRAEAYLLLGRSDSALICLEGAPGTPVEQGRNLRFRGKAAALRGNWKEALGFFQQALKVLYPSFSANRVDDNPAHFSGLFSYNNLFLVLLDKASVLEQAYRNGGTEENAAAALGAYRSAFALADHVARTFESDEARYVVQQSKYVAHGKPIDIAFGLYRRTGKREYLEAAFAFDQQNKASVLAFNEQQERSGALQSAGMQKERSLRAEITRLSLKALREARGEKQNALLTEMRNREIELGRLLRQQGAGRSPEDLVLPPSKDLQKLLDRNTRLLSYHFSGNNISIFEITRDSFMGRQQPLYESFRTDLERALRTLRTGADSLPDRISFDRLYHLLLGGDRPERRLLVIPDDELLYLPFEALPADGHYLVERHSVQYLASTALLRTGVGRIDGAALAMAPFSAAVRGKEHGLPALPASEEEARAAGGQLLSGATATRHAFLERAANTAVIHLATHAVADDAHPELSYIAFAGENDASDSNRLYAAEIYGLRLQKNRLLILSACETGKGALLRGEGLFSLSRAFAYAGCVNRVTSLWKADDGATAYLMKKMHAGLQKGLSPDEALQEAKRSYLSDPAIHPRRKVPAYWAHLIYSGELPEAESGNSAGWLAGGAVLLALLGYWYVRRRRSA